MNELTQQPVRTTTRHHEEHGATDRGYRREVAGPTILYFKLTVVGWISAMLSISLLLLIIAGYIISMAVGLVAISLSGLALACFLTLHRAKELHRDYIKSVRKVTVTQRDERAVVTRQRGIDVNGITNAIVIHRESKTLEGVLITGKNLEAMEDSLNAGKTRLTRDMCGATGRTFPPIREAFNRAGFLNDKEINARGQEWIRTS